MKTRTLLLPFVLLLGACGDQAPECTDACVEGEARCDGDTATTCVRQGACLERKTEVCAADVAVCRAGACAPISDRQRDWVTTVGAAIDAIEENAGLAPEFAVDTTALRARLTSDIFHAADAPVAFYRALRQVALSYPIGHLGIYVRAACGSVDHPAGSASNIGACTQPYKDHAIVSHVQQGNPLDLTAGDEILAVDGKSGAEMMKAALEQPLCDASSASESSRRYMAATSLFTAMRPGSVVRVKHLDGSTVDKTVEKTVVMMGCRDPLGRNLQGVATSYLRSDGVGVIVVPRLHLGEMQTTLPFDEVMTKIRADLVAAFDVVKSAPSIIWDLRANEGGSSLNGLEIVAGMPGAQIGKEVGAYTIRNAGTTSYSPREPYVLQAGSPFAYTGKVAFLVDGLTVSAGDYTSRAAELGADILLVGAPTAGAFGGAAPMITVGDKFEALVVADSARGEDPSGARLESHSAMPKILVELEPADLAKGKDTVMERAAAELLK